MADGLGALLNGLSGNEIEKIPLCSEMLSRKHEKQLTAAEIRQNILAELRK